MYSGPAHYLETQKNPTLIPQPCIILAGDVNVKSAPFPRSVLCSLSASYFPSYFSFPLFSISPSSYRVGWSSIEDPFRSICIHPQLSNTTCIVELRHTLNRPHFSIFPNKSRHMSQSRETDEDTDMAISYASRAPAGHPPTLPSFREVRQPTS